MEQAGQNLFYIELMEILLQINSSLYDKIVYKFTKRCFCEDINR